MISFKTRIFLTLKDKITLIMNYSRKTYISVITWIWNILYLKHWIKFAYMRWTFVFMSNNSDILINNLLFIDWTVYWSIDQMFR